MQKKSKKENVILLPMQMAKSELLFVKPPKHMSEEECVEVWSVLDIMDKKVFSARKKELKSYLLAMAESKGTKNAKGSFIYEVSDGNVTRQRREGKDTLEPGLFFAKMAGNTLAMEKCCRKTVSLTPAQFEKVRGLVDKGDTDLLEVLDGAKDSVDAGVFEGLVAADIIPLNEAKSVISPGAVTWALTVKKPSVMKELETTVKESVKRRKALLNG